MQSRYYDPTTCRFINADSYLSTGQGIIGYNTFAYCLNNPTENVDSSGFSALEALPAAKAKDGAGHYQKTFGDYINSIVPPEVKEREEKIWGVIQTSIDSGAREVLNAVDMMMFSSVALLFAGKAVVVWPVVLGELALSYWYGSVKGFVKGIREAFG